MQRLLAAIFVFVALFAGGSNALAREQVKVKTTSSDKYIRLFFYCKQPVNFTTSLNGETLKISFKRDIDVDAGPIASANSADISAASFSNNTATITLAGSSYSVRKFIGEDFIGVDILKPEQSAQAETADKPEVASKPESINKSEEDVQPLDAFPAEPHAEIPDDKPSEAEKVVASVPQVNKIPAWDEPGKDPVIRGVEERELKKVLPNPKPQKNQKTQAKGAPRNVDVAKLAEISPAADAPKPAEQKPVVVAQAATAPVPAAKALEAKPAETAAQAAAPAAKPSVAPAAAATTTPADANKTAAVPALATTPDAKPAPAATTSPAAAPSLTTSPAAAKPAETAPAQAATQAPKETKPAPAASQVPATSTPAASPAVVQPVVPAAAAIAPADVNKTAATPATIAKPAEPDAAPVPATAQADSNKTPAASADAAKPADATPVVENKQAEKSPDAAAAKNDTVPVNPVQPVAVKSGDAETKPAKDDKKTGGDVIAETADEAPSDNQEAALSPADIFKSKLLSKMVFEWEDKVAASVFKRAGYLWVVFDKNKNVDVGKIVSENAEYFAKGEQLENRFYTILRLKLKTDVNTVAYREKNNWVVGFVKEKTAPMASAKVDIKFSDLSGSKVIVDSESQLKPLRLIDNEVGDEIVILPFAEDSTGVKSQYKYIDFSLIETAQGAVIQVVSDNVDVAAMDIGVEIAGPSNRIANASQSALKELRAKEEEARLKAERLKAQSAELTLIKFNTWKLGGDTSYLNDLKEIEWKIAEVDWSEKNQHRLTLARFYFAHGLYAESLGVISMIREYDEKFGSINDVKIIEATDLYLLGRYKEAADIYDAMNMEELSAAHRLEAQFWRAAADIQISNQIKTDKFLTKNPLEKKDKDEEEGSADKVGNTKLMRDTSTRLLKIIRKMDPDFVNADELQKLEATARFVTDHYQEAISRFEETDLLSSGDVFQAEDNKLWWSASNNKRSDAAELPLITNLDSFLKSYPDQVFNDFGLIAVEDALKRNDLAKAEEILSAFKEETREQQKGSIEFFRGLYYAKNEEDDKAIETWKTLSENVMDPYNRTRATFASTIFQLDKKRIDTKVAIANLNKIRSVWRGDQLEFYTLNMLGEFYMDNRQPTDAFRVWREAISAFPGSDESLLIAKKMSDKFVKIFAQGEADKMTKIDAITLYYEFRELTPIGKAGDEMISKLVDRLIDVDLLDRAAALLTHQVRFRLVGEERDTASTKLVRIHLMNHDAQKALDVLDATENAGINQDLQTERKYMRAQALLDLGKNNKVLAALNDDSSKKASFIRADVYWRNGVWRKVIDELEVPFREIRRDEKVLNLEETNQLIRLAVSYALIDRQRRLQILYEDFGELIEDPAKKNLLTFIAANKGPVDFHNLEQTVEYKDMENFLQNYMNMKLQLGNTANNAAPQAAPAANGAPAVAPAAPAAPTSPSAQATPATPAG